MKYILDFDRVIFDFDSYNKDVEKHKLKEYFVDPRIWDTLSVTDYFFKDAIDFIKSKPKEKLVIITAMSPWMGPRAGEYQKRKIAESKIEKLVSEVVIMEGNKSGYVCERVDGVTVFVDDKLEHLLSVRNKCSEVVCIQLVRPGGTLESLVSDRKDIPVVADFRGVNAIIERQ